MDVLKTHKVDFRILDRPDVPINNHAADDTVFNKGDPAQEMFLVRKGRIAIKLDGVTVEEIEPGEFSAKWR